MIEGRICTKYDFFKEDGERVIVHIEPKLSPGDVLWFRWRGHAYNKILEINDIGQYVIFTEHGAVPIGWTKKESPE